MTDAELEQKFLECAAWGELDRDIAQRVGMLIWALDELDDVRQLTSLLSRER